MLLFGEGRKRDGRSDGQTRSKNGSLQRGRKGNRQGAGVNYSPDFRNRSKSRPNRFWHFVLPPPLQETEEVSYVVVFLSISSGC